MSPRILKQSVLLTALILAAAPSPAQTNPPDTKPAAEAAAKPASRGLLPAGNNYIAIPRGSLGKEYLLSGSLIPQAVSPTSTAMAGRIVKFELFNDGVDLYESTQGTVVTDDLPARRLLTTFPIIEQDDSRIVIDFNKGMRRVFTDIWYSGGELGATAHDRMLEIPQSRVFEVKQDGERLVVRQSAQGRSRQFDADREDRYEIRYFISPYQATDFKSKELSPTESKHVRFFEVQPQLELTSGRATSKIAKFDISQPIQFYYSANTPPDYVEAVKEGILYWNRAFGKDLVKAEKAPAGATAPDVRYNIVQWVPYDNAGFAYADVIVDPRTGASQHGQAYMTSVFAIGGRSNARQLLRLMRGTIEVKEAKEAKDGKDPKPKNELTIGQEPGPRLGIDFMPTATVCNMDVRMFAEQMATGLESMLAEGKLDDAAVMRLSQDYVREVVAHEVGHVLGLSHNFGGSLAADITPKELDEWFHTYITTPETNLFEKRLTASTVMDYNVFKASVFIGHVIHVGKEVLPYDKAAIQWGYFDGKEPQEKKMIYGMFGWSDVRTFDYGTDPVVSAYGDVAETVQGLPNSIIESFIRAKAPRDPRDQIPLDEINLSVNSAASRIAAEMGNILAWFRASTRSLKVENGFDYVGDLDRREVIQAHWKSLNDQVEKVGGIDRLLFSYLPMDLKLELKGEPKGVATAEKIDVKKLIERLGKLLESPAYTNWVGLDEKTHSFTKEEKELIVKRGKKFFEELDKEVIRRVTQLLERSQRDIGVEANKSVADDDIIAQLDKRVIDYCKLVIMAKNEDEHRKGKVDRSLVEVVDYKYDLETRLAAARALGDPIGSYKGWAVDAKGDLNKQLKDEVEAALNIQNFKDFQDSSLSRPLREWYMNQQSILMLLPPKRPR